MRRLACFAAAALAVGWASPVLADEGKWRHPFVPDGVYEVHIYHPVREAIGVMHIWHDEPSGYGHIWGFWYTHHKLDEYGYVGPIFYYGYWEPMQFMGSDYPWGIWCAWDGWVMDKGHYVIMDNRYIGRPGLGVYDDFEANYLWSCGMFWGTAEAKGDPDQVDHFMVGYKID